MVKIPVPSTATIDVDFAEQILSEDELEKVVNDVDKRAANFGAGFLEREVVFENGVLTFTPINGTILINQVIRGMFPGVYVSTRPEKERALEEGLQQRGVYSYDSLCLGGINRNRLGGREFDFAARLMNVFGLENRFNIADFDKKVRKTPALIAIKDIRVEQDGDYGFHYSLGGVKPKIILSDKLLYTGKFKETDCDGLAIPDKNGDRISYPNTGALRGVFLDGGLGLSGGCGWSYAGCSSRVVLTDTREASRAA